MRSLVISERCVVDPTRPCGACSAPGPGQCPYRYLLDADEMEEIRERTPVRVRRGAAPDGEPAGPDAFPVRVSVAVGRAS